jgi:multicomponent Na+:H+ antiporter subunit D
VYWFGNWRPRNGIALGISFVIDPVGAGLATLCSFLTLAALVFSTKYFDPAGALYHVLVLIFLAAMCGFSLTGDAFNMFVFFELMSASAFALCGYKTEERESLQGAANFGVTNTIGAFLVLDGLALLYARTGALNLAQVGQSLGKKMDGLLIIAFLFMTAGFLIKAAIVPFHFWLADAHAVAPTPICVLFSGVMVELGLYAVARIYWTIFAGPFAAFASSLATAFVLLGAVTALTGAGMCFAQFHLKRMLAFSTISHVGLLFIGFGLLTPAGLSSLFVYLVGHSLVKAALFLATGILLHRFRTVDELELRGQCWISPVTGAIFAAGGLALAGMPPFATFFGAAQLDDAARSSGFWWVVVVTSLSAIGTGGAVLRSAGRIFLGLGPGRPVAERRSEDEVERPSPISHVMTVPAVVLLVIAAMVGPLPSFHEAAAEYSLRMQDSASYARRVLEGTATPAVSVQAHNTSIAAVAQSAGVTAAALLVAWFSLTRRFPQGHRIMRPLRSLHSGIVGDYVMWIVVGVVILGMMLFYITSPGSAADMLR